MTDPVAAVPVAPVPRQDVVFFLKDALAAGPRSHGILVMQARTLGITEKQLERAAVKIGIHRKKLQAGKGSEWSLTSELPTAPAPTKAASPVPAIAELAKTVDMLQRAGRLITIWRILPGIPTPAYVTQVAASDFSLGWVKRALGGGRFIIDTIEVAIEGRPREYVDPTDPTPVVGNAPVVQPTSDINDKLFALVLKQLEVSQVRVSTDPLEMALKIVALLRGPVAEPQKPGELLALIGQLRELGMVGDAVADKPETNMLDVAKELAPALNGLVSAVMQGRAGAAGLPPTGAPATTTGPVVPAAPAVPMLAPMSSDGQPTPVFPANPVGMAVRELFPYLPMVNVQARNPNARHADVAKFLLDSASAKVYATIDDAVSDPTFVEQATDLLAPHVPPDLVSWYAHLAAAIRDDVFADRRAAETEGRGSGG